MDAIQRSDPKTVLLVEDNPDDAALLEVQLADVEGGERFVVRHVQTLDTALSVLWSAQIDVVLLDLALPDSFGLGTLELLQSAAPSVPIVVLTGLADDEASVQAISLGAQDYIVKGAPAAPVARTLVQSIARHGRRVPASDGDVASAFQVTHDPMTGLPNRYLFGDRLERAVARARRYRDHLGLLVLRLWSMPWNGDNADAQMRDSVVIETARRLKARTRGSDTVARIGEAAFAVILERATDRMAVSAHLGGLVEALERPVPWKTSRISVRIHPGLAFCPQDAGDWSALLTAAEIDGVALRG